MLRRIIYFFLVTVLLGGLGGAIAFYAFEWKPKFLAQAIMSAPRPGETVSAEPARIERWQPQITAIGTLVAVNGIDVTPEVGGIVEEIYFESGQAVEKGDRLVQLDTATEEADLKNLEVQLKNAEAELQRTEAIFKKGFSPRSELDEARTRRDQLLASIERTKALIAQKSIFAPWGGRLGLRTIAVGKYVAPGQPIVWLQSIDPIFADFTVTEANFGRLEAGQRVHAAFEAYPGTVFNGEVLTTDAKVSDASRMITVRARIDNPQGKLLPGMYANVTVDVGEPLPVVTVPQTAITYTLYGDSILVVVPAKDADPAAKEPELEIERRLVTPGSVRDGRVEIVSGLDAGEQIVVAGQNKVDQGSKVRIDNSVALKAPTDRLSQ